MAPVGAWSHVIGMVIKGRSDVIIRDGKVDEASAIRCHFSEHDILEDLRVNGNVSEVGEVVLAVFEWNGQISVVRRR